MILAKLAFACFIFTRLDKGAYEKLLEEIGGCLNLSNISHCLTTLKWLSAWGVRGIPKEYHESQSDTSQQLKSWYENSRLFNRINREKTLQNLGDDDWRLVIDAFDNLLRVPRIGPTAAAKIMFAIRPKAFVAWDKRIQETFQCNGTGESYVKFLKQIQSEIQELERDCQKHHFELNDLPEKIKKPNATIVKLIDEYHWVTITRQCDPNRKDFETWFEWSDCWEN